MSSPRSFFVNNLGPRGDPCVKGVMLNACIIKMSSAVFTLLSATYAVAGSMLSSKQKSTIVAGSVMP